MRIWCSKHKRARVVADNGLFPKNDMTWVNIDNASISDSQRVNEWKTPGKKTIMRCAVNQRQVVIALSGGELVYFEMDPTGQLNEYTERKEMPAEVIYVILKSN